MQIREAVYPARPDANPLSAIQSRPPSRRRYMHSPRCRSERVGVGIVSHMPELPVDSGAVSFPVERSDDRGCQVRFALAHVSIGITKILVTLPPNIPIRAEFAGLIPGLV